MNLNYSGDEPSLASLPANINLSLSSRLEFVMNFTNPEYEPFYEEYKVHLFELNKIVKSTGEALEGNLFYNHHDTELDNLLPEFLPKRRLFSMMAVMHDSVVEIGFNAGHSALLLLISNPKLQLTCIDICVHKYTPLCFQYLKRIFGSRIELINANSLLAFPLIAKKIKEVDLFIIDGGHGVDVAEADLLNVIQYCRKNSIIVFDDADYPPLRVLLDMYLLTGKIISISDQIGFIKNLKQMVFINNK